MNCSEILESVESPHLTRDVIEQLARAEHQEVLSEADFRPKGPIEQPELQGIAEHTHEHEETNQQYLLWGELEDGK
jgi:hypothetical protein